MKEIGDNRISISHALADAHRIQVLNASAISSRSEEIIEAFSDEFYVKLQGTGGGTYADTRHQTRHERPANIRRLSVQVRKSAKRIRNTVSGHTQSVFRQHDYI